MWCDKKKSIRRTLHLVAYAVRSVQQRADNVFFSALHFERMSDWQLSAIKLMPHSPLSHFLLFFFQFLLLQFLVCITTALCRATAGSGSLQSKVIIYVINGCWLLMINLRDFFVFCFCLYHCILAASQTVMFNVQCEWRLRVHHRKPCWGQQCIDQLWLLVGKYYDWRSLFRLSCVSRVSIAPHDLVRSMNIERK